MGLRNVLHQTWNQVVEVHYEEIRKAKSQDRVVYKNGAKRVCMGPSKILYRLECILSLEDRRDIIVTKIILDDKIIDIADVESVSLNGVLDRLWATKRFNGRSPMSVLEHSIIVAGSTLLLDGSCKTGINGLFHDFHEAWIGDILRPVKSFLKAEADGENDLKYLIEELDFKIHRKWKRDVPISHGLSAIKAVDEQAFLWEVMNFTGIFCNVERSLYRELVPTAKNVCEAVSDASRTVWEFIHGKGVAEEPNRAKNLWNKLFQDMRDLIRDTEPAAQQEV